MMSNYRVSSIKPGSIYFGKERSLNSKFQAEEEDGNISSTFNTEIVIFLPFIHTLEADR